MQQTQGSRSGKQTGAKHTASMPGTAVTESAGVAVSTRKNFYNQGVHPHRFLTGKSHGNTVCSYVFPSPCLLPLLQKPSLHFHAPQILRMRLKSTLDFKIYLLWLNTALRRLLNVSTHNFLLFLLVLPGNQYSDPGVAERTIVHSRGKSERKKNATTAANLFWRFVIGRIFNPTIEICRTCPTKNRPREINGRRRGNREESRE